MRTWGVVQAEHYVTDLELCCERLLDHPQMGRACDEIRKGLRRIEQASHVIFYRQVKGGIMISRILHERMVAGQRSFPRS